MQRAETSLEAKASTALNDDERDGRDLLAPRAKAKPSRRRLSALPLLFSDLGLGFLVSEAAIVIHGVWGHDPLSEISVSSIVPIIVVWIAIRALLGLYPGYGLDQTEELRRQSYAVGMAVAVTMVFGFASHTVGHMSRLVIFSTFIGLLVLSPFVRYFIKRQMRRIRLWGKPVVILGYGETGVELLKLLEREWTLGYRPVAIFDNRQAPAKGSLDGVPYGGTLGDAMFSGRTLGVDTAIFAMPHTRRERLSRYVDWASDKFSHVMIIPNLGGITNSAVTARDLAGTFGVEIRYNLLNPWALRTKRALDLVATLLGAVLAVPLIAVISLLVYLESGRPIFYKDWRMGKDNQLFKCVKFRTMVPNSEVLLQKLLAEDPAAREEYTRYHKLTNDPRITRVGRFLRKSSLDELPQLWNVLRGEMSLVGPRPYLPRESSDIGGTQREILRVSPGITGPWQVSGRSSSSFEERVKMDAYYVRDWSVWLDLVILARTVKSVVLRDGAC